ncbi:hypothetical protein A2W14_06625 [Candidatus Gottesmanbacteria bacterium RBG_16_37_8]|uniref:Uncharacterized protein n=1 Tax=Candidatus Gottesmanbacteria bacterium RBG_16_37_8 TaxID=1798371 RepID=A0A1F5YRS7_9BACT|nr:MAG: hypothetical protein A2W14_06625 [Candidatus Gottesmanbacteria bacterium RBG_16_37_8]
MAAVQVLFPVPLYHQLNTGGLFSNEVISEDYQSGTISKNYYNPFLLFLNLTFILQIFDSF